MRQARYSDQVAPKMPFPAPHLVMARKTKAEASLEQVMLAIPSRLFRFKYLPVA
jgi:hypothetical protein